MSNDGQVAQRETENSILADKTESSRVVGQVEGTAGLFPLRRKNRFVLRVRDSLLFCAHSEQCGRNGLVFAENGAASVSADTGGEAALWANVGQWRLQRDEPQAALVALKRSESLTPDPSIRGRLQLLQAKALVRLGQTPAATAILVQAAGGTDPRLARPALAVLGAARLREGGTQQGFQLLRRAVEEDPTVQWPKRAEAEADLGLAHLLLGDETAGLRWLHQAQETFEATGQYDALFQSLENELACLEQAQQQEAARRVRQRLDQTSAR